MTTERNPCEGCNGLGFVRIGDAFKRYTYPKCARCAGEGSVAAATSPPTVAIEDDNHAWGYGCFLA